MLKTKPGLASILMTLIFLLTATAGIASCGDEDTTKTETQTTSPGGRQILTPGQLTDIAPGLGVLMMELGQRNWILYYAATNGNWDLASYQLTEMKGTIEVAETTRPKRKDALTAFVQSSLNPLETAIKAKDSAMFAEAWKNEVQGCNGCHATSDFSYIQWTLPPEPPQHLSLNAP